MFNRLSNRPDNNSPAHQLLFTRTTLCVSLCCRRVLSVCLSQAGIVSKQLNLS